MKLKDCYNTETIKEYLQNQLSFTGSWRKAYQTTMLKIDMITNGYWTDGYIEICGFCCVSCHYSRNFLGASTCCYCPIMDLCECGLEHMFDGYPKAIPPIDNTKELWQHRKELLIERREQILNWNDWLNNN